MDNRAKGRAVHLLFPSVFDFLYNLLQEQEKENAILCGCFASLSISAAIKTSSRYPINGIASY
jgi:hypothetical protein